MENLIREFTRSVVPNHYQYYQDQPLDLSVKRMKIPVTQAQLENIKMKVENTMPSMENMALETINPMIEPGTVTPMLHPPKFNNSWEMMKSLILMPHQLESRQQIFNAINTAYPITDEFYNVAALEAAKLMNVTEIRVEEISNKENYATPKSTTNKRARNSIDKSTNSKRIKLEDNLMPYKCPVLADNDGVSERVVIRANGTSISRKDWNSINWRLSPAAITRKVLMVVFDKHTLAHHTLSGKPSPAFIDCNKPEKGKLNPQMVEDIISFMTTHFEIKDRDVKCAITSKCADEAKSLRQRLSVGHES